MDWSQKNDVELESHGAENLDIILETNAKKCKVCKTGDVVRCSAKSEDTFMIYTRDGTVKAKHIESRCNNRHLPCRAGHYYGYVSLGEKANSDKPKCYDKHAFNNEYLVTSSQTAFSVSYLWDCLLQIVFSNASFESLAKIYNNLHLVNLPMDVMLRRVEINRKRIAEAVFLFSYLELGQRYGLSPIISGGIDETILRNRCEIRDKFRKVWSVDHKCEVKGCESVLIVDGGMKPTRSLCAAKLHGIKEFNMSGMKVVCGCQKAPQPNSKFCGEHVGLSTPAMTSDQVSEQTRSSLRSHRNTTSTFKGSPQDNIYVIETVLGKKVEKSKVFWKIKWLGFPNNQATWEPASNIQPWIQSYYESHHGRFGKPLPEPKIKWSKKAGDEVYYHLSWEGDEDTSSRWVGQSFFSLASEDGEIVSQLEEAKSCNTTKTKDKRDRRHTVGIMVGTKPCGTVVLFDELYGSESLTQVYGMLVEYISRLPSVGRDSLKNILYDDACHLKKFSENKKERANRNEFTQFLASVPKHVDNFHFKNHVDAWCHKMCNPKDARSLDGVNTESCEQTFKWVNKFTSVKAMNESRFWLFFTYIFDLHNLMKQGNLRSVANPKSPLRWELLPNLDDFEPSLLQMSGKEGNEELHEKQEFEELLEKLSEVDLEEPPSSDLECTECGAVYKKTWTLRNHMKKKHSYQDHVSHECDKCTLQFADSKSLSTHVKSYHPKIFVCDICMEVFLDKASLTAHVKTHPKVYICEECKEVFPDQNSLKCHRSTHYVCNVCKRVCDTKYYLDRHMKSHKI